MSEEKKDYTQILKRARRRRKRAKYLHYAGIGVILLLLALCIVMFAKKESFPVLSRNSGKRKLVPLRPMRRKRYPVPKRQKHFP